MLGLHNYGAGNDPTPETSASTTANTYQQSYGSIVAASDAYLQNSLVNGPPAVLPQYTDGTSAGSFAQLNTMLASLKNGLDAGLFSGSGVNALA